MDYGILREGIEELYIKCDLIIITDDLHREKGITIFLFY